MQYLIIIIFLISLLIIGCFLFLYKKNLKMLNRQMIEILKKSSNRRINLISNEKQSTLLAVQINTLLNQHRDILNSNKRQQEQLQFALTNLAHDIRTPLTVSRGYLHMLQTQDLPNPDIEKAVTMTASNLERLTQLLDSLFDYIKIKENIQTPKYEKINLSSLIMEELFSFHEALDTHKIIPHFAIEEQVFIFADLEQIRRTIQNLAANVLSHGKNFVQFTLSRHSDFITLEVENGTNINEIDIENVFSRFYTEDSSRNNRNAGLGLSIVKEIVEAHHGRICAELENEIFSIKLELPALPISTVKQINHSDYLK